MPSGARPGMPEVQLENALGLWFATDILVHNVKHRCGHYIREFDRVASVALTIVHSCDGYSIMPQQVEPAIPTRLSSVSPALVNKKLRVAGW